jgi:hypothetical protein
MGMVVMQMRRSMGVVTCVKGTVIEEHFLLEEHRHHHGLRRDILTSAVLDRAVAAVRLLSWRWSYSGVTIEFQWCYSGVNAIVLKCHI